MNPAKLLSIHLTEGERQQDRPLYESIVEKCRELKLAGATVFRGLEGFGDTAELHRRHLLASDPPIVIEIVDSAENIERAMPALEAMLGGGLLAVSGVTAIRVHKTRDIPQ